MPTQTELDRPIPTGCYRRELNGVLCDFDERNPHRLIWCSDWGRVLELPLRRQNYGPSTYSHSDFYDTQE